MDVGKLVFDGMTQRPQTAILVLLLAGVLSAFGPCGAQRALGLVATTTSRPRASTAGYFAGGIAVACMLLLLSTAVVRQLIESAHAMTICMAIACSAVGIFGLWQAEAHQCRAHDGQASVGRFGAFSLGFGSSLFIAPCCTPFLLFAAAYASPKMLVPNAIAYGIGCALPYLATGIFARRIVGSLVGVGMRQAVRIVGSTIALAMGLLYAVEV